jgi:flagellin
VQNENISAANSRIRDTDVAMATSDMTKNSILMSANTSVLAQANQIPQSALKLIG